MVVDPQLRQDRADRITDGADLGCARLGRGMAVTGGDTVPARPPQTSIVLADHAVSPAIADPVMVAQQVRHLLDRAAWPRVEVRVLPTAAYTSTGIVIPFVLMDFVEADSLVHVGDELADRVVRDVGEVAWFDDQFQQLAKLSQELSDSRAVTTGVRMP